MNNLKLFFTFIILHAFVYESSRASLQDLVAAMTPSATSAGCISFSPYVNGLTPDYGPAPSYSTIATLLQKLFDRGWRCIMIYDMSGPHVTSVSVAQQLGMKVLAHVYISPQSLQPNNIDVAINTANTYRRTILAISCGSEVAYGNNNLEGTRAAVLDCKNRLRQGGVTQPIGYIDIATVWCSGAEYPCTAGYALGNEVDFVGVNEFPWWENTYSRQWPCVTAANAPQQTIFRRNLVQNLFPTKTVILTEFGWPGSNIGVIKTAPNVFTQQQCGETTRDIQRDVNQRIINLCASNRIPCNLFAAFDESWKQYGNSNDINGFWGICSGTAPYNCYEPTPTRAF